MCRVTAMPFFETISVHHTSFLRTCIKIKYSVVELCNWAAEFPACLYDKVAIKRMKRGVVFWRMRGPVPA